MAKIDKKQVLELLKRGMNDHDVAQALDNIISHDTVRRHRINFELDGLLEPREGRLARKRRKPINPDDAWSWAEIQDAILRSLQQAREAERLHDENEKLTKLTSTLKEQLEATEKALREAIGDKQRYELMIQQGEIPMPLYARR